MEQKGARYQVHTQYGWFSLDEGAYQDYLAGKLWITWTPGKKDAARELSPQAAVPPDVTEAAVRLREEAGREGVLPALERCCGGRELGSSPYRPGMAEIRIEELNLTVRAGNGLRRAGVFTFGDLHRRMAQEQGLLSIRNLGTKSVKEIREAFLAECYERASLYEKAAFWQRVLDETGMDC